MRLKLPKIRIAKTYLIEAVMIVFSVLVALMLNEVRNTWMENRQTKQILSNVKVEITRNQETVEKLAAYHNSVVRSVEDAIESDSLQMLLIGNKGFEFYMLAPNGIIQDKIHSTSWEIALNSNIALRTDFKTTILLTELYDQQKVVQDAVNVLVAIFESREVHKKENLKETLILLRNSVSELQGREYSLLVYYKDALETLSSY